MPTVAEVVRRYGPAYLERFGATMPAAHKKVLRDIAGLPDRRAGDGPLPLRGLRADACHGPIVRRPALPELPARQGRGLARDQTDRLLPCPYFLVTFTLPAGLRDVARGHQRAVYAALFRASSEALRTLAADPKYHRHGSAGVLRRPAHLGPDAGVSSPCPLRRARRRAQRRRRSLAGVARRLPGAGQGAVDPLPGQVPRPAGRRGPAGAGRPVGLAIATGWCTASRPATAGESLRYLAPYVFRVAIGDHRIVSCDDGRVTFTYRKVGSKRRRKMTLDATEFLRRFLQHVLPSGFPKVRHYGFLSPASGVGLELVRWLIALWAGLTYVLRARRAEGPAAPARVAGRARRAAVRWCGWGSCRRRCRPSFDTS